jgi:DNA ligase-associated metallophosphoesterase
VLEFAWNDEVFVASPAGTLWWPRRRTLLVADLHLGKPAAFRAAFVPVPDGACGRDLARLSEHIERLTPARLVVLGDLLHARSARTRETLVELASWRRRHDALKVLLIRGNHDQHAGDPWDELRFRVVDEPAREPDDGRVMFAHHPEAAMDGALTLCGHLHPAATLVGAVSSRRAPCYWIRAASIVLPAFGSFTGCARIAPALGDRVLVINGEEIVEANLSGAGASRPSRGPLSANAPTGDAGPVPARYVT